jgi:hypothetical protein
MIATKTIQSKRADVIAYIIARTSILPQVYLDEGREYCVGEFPEHVDIDQLTAEFYADARLQKFIDGKRYFFSRVRSLNAPYREQRP